MSYLNSTEWFTNVIVTKNLNENSKAIKREISEDIVCILPWNDWIANEKNKKIPWTRSSTSWNKVLFPWSSS